MRFARANAGWACLWQAARAAAHRPTRRPVRRRAAGGTATGGVDDRCVEDGHVECWCCGSVSYEGGQVVVRQRGVGRIVPVRDNRCLGHSNRSGKCYRRDKETCA